MKKNKTLIMTILVALIIVNSYKAAKAFNITLCLGVTACLVETTAKVIETATEIYHKKKVVKNSKAIQTDDTEIENEINHSILTGI